MPLNPVRYDLTMTDNRSLIAGRPCLSHTETSKPLTPKDFDFFPEIGVFDFLVEISTIFLEDFFSCPVTPDFIAITERACHPTTGAANIDIMTFVKNIYDPRFFH